MYRGNVDTLPRLLDTSTFFFSFGNAHKRITEPGKILHSLNQPSCLAFLDVQRADNLSAWHLLFHLLSSLSSP